MIFFIEIKRHSSVWELLEWEGGENSSQHFNPANSGHCESWHYPRAPVKCVGGQLLWWWSIWRELPWPSQGSDWESERGREAERGSEGGGRGRERQWKMDFHTFIIAVTPYVLRSNFTFENGTAAQIKNDINFCQQAHIAFFIPGETLLD